MAFEIPEGEGDGGTLTQAQRQSVRDAIANELANDNDNVEQNSRYQNLWSCVAGINAMLNSIDAPPPP